MSSLSAETTEAQGGVAAEDGCSSESGYQVWVVTEARIIKSDGCTKSRDWNLWCCYEHDLACHYGKDPRDAFRHFKEGAPDYWLRAAYFRRRDADKRFWQCNRKAAPALVGKIRSDIRYIGVRIGALWPF